MLLSMLDSVYRRYPNIGVTLVLQGYKKSSPVIAHPSVADGLLFPDPIGPHSARVAGLPRMLENNYEAIVNLDDDIELIKETDFEPSVEQSTLPTIGVITNNWRRTHGMASEVQLKQEFKNQSIVPTGGGLAYSK